MAQRKPKRPTNTHAVMSRDDIAARFGISPQRVWQIEQRAFEKLRRAIKRDKVLGTIVQEMFGESVIAD